MLPGSFQQTLFAKLLLLIIPSFRNTIGVKQDGIAWSQLTFFHSAIPFVEQAHHRRSCPQSFQTVVAAQKQGRRMAAVRVAQLTGIFVVFGEEQSSESPLG